MYKLLKHKPVKQKPPNKCKVHGYIRELPNGVIVTRVQVSSLSDAVRPVYATGKLIRVKLQHKSKDKR